MAVLPPIINTPINALQYCRVKKGTVIIMKKVGIIGYGGMGQWHACSIMGTLYCNCIQFNKSDCCELAGIYDIDPAKRQLARDNGVPVYETLNEILGDSQIDLITVATPNDTHEELVVSALNAGKNVICEKPVAMSLDSLNRMIDAANKNNRKFSVHQNRRFDNYFVAMKDLCAKDTIGDVISMESRVHSDHGVPGDWRKTVEAGGGMLYDWGVHMLDQQLWMLGYDVESVYARFDYLTGIPVDDGCYIDVRLKSGKQLRVEICTYNFIPLPLMYVRGRTGTAICPGWDAPIQITRCTDWGDKDDILPVKVAAGLSRTVAPRSDRSIERLTVELDKTDPHDYYRNFCDAIDGKCEQVVTHDQMRTVLRVIEAAFESAKTGNSVKF